MQASLKDQMESLKQQYEHWLSQKDKILENYVQKFNEYRQKKRDQLTKCELEVVRLYDHVERVESILVGFEKGEYPVVQKQGYHGRPTTGVILSLDLAPGTLPNLIGSNSATAKPISSGFLGYTKAGSIAIPKGIRPTNPLLPDRKGEMTLAKKIVMKYRDQEEAYSKEKTKSMQQAQLLTSMGTLDPEIQQQIKDMLDLTTQGKSRAKTKSRGGSADFVAQDSFSDVNDFLPMNNAPENGSIRPFTGRQSAPAGASRGLMPVISEGLGGESLIVPVSAAAPGSSEELQSLRDEVAFLRAENTKKKVVDFILFHP
jgi:hypothetical protein